MWKGSYLACELALINGAVRRAYLGPREDLIRVTERFFRDLVLITSAVPLADLPLANVAEGLIFYRGRRVARAEAPNKGLLPS